jgi:hypothetical protein
MALKFNEFGTCWLREPGTGPAIFTSPNRSDSKGCKPGKFFVSDGIDGAGVLMDNNGICYFDTPEEALKALQSHRSHASRLARFPEKG